MVVCVIFRVGMQAFPHRRTQSEEWRPFKEALSFVWSLELISMEEWRRTWCHSQQQPTGMPPEPDIEHKDVGWTSFRHWLGAGVGGASETLLHAAASAEREAGSDSAHVSLVINGSGSIVRPLLPLVIS